MHRVRFRLMKGVVIVATALFESSANPIYTASRTRHAPRWKDLRASGVPIIATWIDEAGPGETADMSELWGRCINEAKSAGAVILYREDGETLKGALVEVGAALGAGVPVYVVGCIDTSEYSWLNHPLVTLCRTVDSALRLIGNGGKQ